MSEEILELNNIKEPEVEPEDKKCAPGVEFKDGSCINLELLVILAEEYNKLNDNSIRLSQKTQALNPSKYKQYLVSKLQDRLGGTQRSWIKQRFIDNLNNKSIEELTKFTFRPEGPSGSFKWLNTIDINESMEQYEKKYPEFKFMGAVPIDFDKLELLGIKDLNYKIMTDTGKTKLGFVFNLDRHDQPGSHWVGLYTDLSKAQIYFFDSYGIEPHKNIKTLMKRIARAMKNELNFTEQDITLRWNTIRHQYENSECGVYSINFILRLLRGDDFDTIIESKTPDKKVNKCRNVYFTKELK